MLIMKLAMELYMWLMKSLYRFSCQTRSTEATILLQCQHRLRPRNITMVNLLKDTMVNLRPVTMVNQKIRVPILHHFQRIILLERQQYLRPQQYHLHRQPLLLLVKRQQYLRLQQYHLHPQHPLRQPDLLHQSYILRIQLLTQRLTQ